MDALEHAAVASLRGVVATRIETEAGAPWDARRLAACELLANVNHAWWGCHNADPSAYERDLGRLNAIAGWTGCQAQVAVWRSAQGQPMIMPPKFFGGDPGALDEMFIASISLNHAILNDAAFATELGDQQTAEECFSAHRDYFARAYAYKKFFGPRARVLHAYATQAARLPVPPLEDWRTLNRRFALYVEAFPTRSCKFQEPPRAPPPAVLEREVFVCALNAIARDVVLRLLRPRRVLLAGQSTWGAWQDPTLASRGASIVLRRTTNAKCPVFRQQAMSTICGAQVVVVRTNFLRSVHGPNSNDELTRLGRDVLA